MRHRNERVNTYPSVIRRDSDSSIDTMTDDCLYASLVLHDS
ncbi:hypothetical protein L829_0929 [Mycobacteroides abscessus MAB_030201_1075]|uniref:Uncharacterized protein n=1 Tax=Mycobacteroides abscessus MAB_030201_1075 TaxID=1335410 RepID=A0A829PGR5_9MYCO|nr:hypothetical protein L835_2947 [Mycobacteroides abscessus MAB_110811_1470]ETZ87383.1 hypothetical protein L829_0929 [Mycobacteroides abscessus MAB_030201_1075]ETZ96195.1 hypothetical protein L828_3011 [Mycobacteroides abscessus MAB_030201_1061]